MLGISLKILSIINRVQQWSANHHYLPKPTIEVLVFQYTKAAMGLVAVVPTAAEVMEVSLGNEAGVKAGTNHRD